MSARTRRTDTHTHFYTYDHYSSTDTDRRQCHSAPMLQTLALCYIPLPFDPCWGGDRFGKNGCYICVCAVSSAEGGLWGDWGTEIAKRGTEMGWPTDCGPHSVAHMTEDVETLKAVLA